MRNARLLKNKPINVKGADKALQQEVKILGVLIDSCLRYKDHKAKIGIKELKAATALKRMRSLTLLIVRQLFHATVALVIKYALIIWAHTLGPSADKIFQRI